MLTRRNLGLALGGGLLGGGLLGGGMTGLAARAQTGADPAAAYPDRPVTLVVPWAAGGPTDVFGRLLASGLSTELGKPFVVENRTGANGTIGFASVARAKPDGYTLLVGTNSTYAGAPHLYKLPYDNDRSFTAVGLMAEAPIFIMVPRNSPARTLADYVELVKRSGGKEVYANSGSGSTTHIGTEMFLQMAGLQVSDVGYRGGGPAIQGVLAGEAGMFMMPAPAVMSFLQSGDLRAIAVASRRRTVLAPEVPTVAESGYPEYEMVEHVALLAPAGTPPAILRKLNAAAARALATPAMQERLTALAITPNVQPPEAWAAYQAAESAKLGGVIRSRNIQVQ